MLLGLTGKAGSGKDTAYGYIRDWAARQGRFARRDAFADRLKISAARALGCQGTPQELIDLCNKLKQPGWEVVVHEPGGFVDHPISGREYLQFYGTEAHRQVFGNGFWINAVLDSYFAVTGEILVVTDVRFPNEAEAIRDRDGEIWQLVRPGHMIDESSHASEQELPAELLDRVIVNCAGLPDLQALIIASMEQVTA